MAKVKVKNTIAADIWIRRMSGQVLPIRGKATIPLDEEDVEYIKSISNCFITGHLVVLDEEKESEILEEYGVDTEDNPAFMTDEEIAKKLKGTVANIRKWMEGITDEIMLKRIYDIAKASDLPASKMDVVNEIVFPGGQE